MAIVRILSEGIWVMFVGSGLGMVKLLSPLVDTIKYLLSGYSSEKHQFQIRSYLRLQERHG
jgi:hypothetical protein